jgi:hypothetical protein
MVHRIFLLDCVWYERSIRDPKVPVKDYLKINWRVFTMQAKEAPAIRKFPMEFFQKFVVKVRSLGLHFHFTS